MTASSVRLLAVAMLALAGCAAGRPAAAPSAPRSAAVRRGYAATVVNGRNLYCRTEIITGTLLRTRVCLTAEQLEAEERDTEATAEELRRARGVDCSGRQGKCVR